MHERLSKYVHLQAVKLGQMLRLQSPADFRMARECACSRAWGIDKNPLETTIERKRLRGIERDQPNAGQVEPLKLRAHGAHAVRMQIGSND